MKAITLLALLLTPLIVRADAFEDSKIAAAVKYPALNDPSSEFYKRVVLEIEFLKALKADVFDTPDSPMRIADAVFATWKSTTATTPPVASVPSKSPEITTAEQALKVAHSNYIERGSDFNLMALDAARKDLEAAQGRRSKNWRETEEKARADDKEAYLQRLADQRANANAWWDEFQTQQKLDAIRAQLQRR